MLTHVVLVRFADLATAEEAAQRLLAMEGKIPSMLGIEAGVDITRSARSYELALITRHRDAEGLAAYQIHAVHQAVLTFLKAHALGSVAVDFQSEPADSD